MGNNMQQSISPLPELRFESSSVLSFQAWWWARPHSPLLWWTPLSLRVWPVWLQLPWFSAARPRAALHSTLLLVSPVHQDRSTTTVSQWPGHLTWRHQFTLFLCDHRTDIPVYSILVVFLLSEEITSEIFCCSAWNFKNGQSSLLKLSNGSLSLPRHPAVCLLFWPRAVFISWSLPAMH